MADPAQNNKDIFARLLGGEEVRVDDAEFPKFNEAVYRTLKLSAAMNACGDIDEVRRILSDIVGYAIDPSIAVFPPFYTNFGKHINLGKRVFINHACSFLDLGGIRIEDDVLIGPKASLITENHPGDPQNRRTLVCKPIHIKRNAWIGAAATILPGVTIGENAIVAAGAVVTRDVPDNAVVAGVPARVVRMVV